MVSFRSGFVSQWFRSGFVSQSTVSRSYRDLLSREEMPMVQFLQREDQQ